MTPKQILELVTLLDDSSTRMLRFLRKQRGGQWHDLMAYDYAKIAGHYANQLIDLAERGEGRAA